MGPSSLGALATLAAFRLVVRKQLQGGALRIYSSARARRHLGPGDRGGDSSAMREQLQGDVLQIYSSARAFAVVRGDAARVPLCASSSDAACGWLKVGIVRYVC